MFLPRRVSTGGLVRAGSCLGEGVCLLCRMFLIDNYNILNALPQHTKSYRFKMSYSVIAPLSTTIRSPSLIVGNRPR
jgi:hypothetical protein